MYGSREDGRENRVPVYRSHRGKRIGECIFWLVSNLIAQGRWMFENRVFRANEAFGGIIFGFIFGIYLYVYVYLH